MNVAEPLLATDELDAGGAGFALLVCAYGIGSTLGALRGRADRGSSSGAWRAEGSRCARRRSRRRCRSPRTFLVTGLFAGAVMSSDHQLVTRMAPVAIRGRVFGLKDSLDSIAFCAAFAGGGVIASLGGSRAVFAVSGGSRRQGRAAAGWPGRASRCA